MTILTYSRNFRWFRSFIIQIVLLVAFVTIPNKAFLQTIEVRCMPNDPWCAAAGLGNLAPSLADQAFGGDANVGTPLSIADIEAKTNSLMKLLEKQAEPEKKVRTFSIAYYNPLTEEIFVGDRIFDKNDLEAALETLGQRNTVAPSDVGWRPLSYNQYVSYIRKIRGMDNPIETVIYNNCVISKSRGVSDKILREVRSSCRAVARNPSSRDLLRWGK